MLLVQPTEGADVGVWASFLTSLFALIDQHDHGTGKGVKVPVASLNVNADVAMSSAGVYYAVKDAKAVDFQPQAIAGMSAYAGALFVNSADNELYWRTTGGTNVKLTSGSTLNVSLLGTIGGDYGAIGALIDYDDPTDTYRMRQQLSTVRQYARVAHGDLDLYEYFAAGVVVAPSNRVRLRSPAALATSYVVTFPAAVPAARAVVQMDNAGVLTASPADSITSGAIAATGTVAVTGALTVSTTANISGVATLGATLTVAGATTANGAVALNAGATIATGNNLTLVGTARFKHPNFVKRVPITLLQNATSFSLVGGIGVGASIGGGVPMLEIPMLNGQRVKRIYMGVSDAIGAASTYQMTFYKNSTSFATSNVSVGSGASQALIINGLSELCVVNQVFTVTVARVSGTGTAIVYDLEIEYDEV